MDTAHSVCLELMIERGVWSGGFCSILRSVSIEVQFRTTYCFETK